MSEMCQKLHLSFCVLFSKSLLADGKYWDMWVLWDLYFAIFTKLSTLQFSIEHQPKRLLYVIEEMTVKENGNKVVYDDIEIFPVITKELPWPVP